MERHCKKITRLVLYFLIVKPLPAIKLGALRPGRKAVARTSFGQKSGLTNLSGSEEPFPAPSQPSKREMP